MKTRVISIGLTVAGITAVALAVLQMQPKRLAHPTTISSEGYEALLEASQNWTDIDGVKVDPALRITSPKALDTRLNQGHVLTKVDPASGRITIVTDLPDE